MSKKKVTIIIVGILIISLAIALVLRIKNKMHKNYCATDTSQDVYLTDHFDENCRTKFKYSVCNGDDILYIDQTNLYRMSDRKIILSDINIQNMIYTDVYLYVLDMGSKLHIVNMNTLKEYVLEGVKEMEYNCGKLYFIPEGQNALFCIEETEIIRDEKTIGFAQMDFVENRVCLYDYVYEEDSTYWVNCDGRDVFVCRSPREDSNKKIYIGLDNVYNISGNNLSFCNGNTYLLYNIKSTNTYYVEGKQDATYCDGIFVLDFNEKKAKKIYETENNLTRIVGFDAEKNIVYLYDVNNNQINALDLNTNQTEKIDTLQRKYNSLIFDMNKDILFVYTDNNELVKIVELNN
ncbi:MAG: hypothetical protein Q4D54_09265 [Eubacteriales bacterium]|nr:hypothetical protein [Eubacteriales bacterium]